MKMQFPYIVLDDTGFNVLHAQQFSTLAAAVEFIHKHKLHTTHLVYDLRNAAVQNLYK